MADGNDSDSGTGRCAFTKAMNFSMFESDGTLGDVNGQVMTFKGTLNVGVNLFETEAQMARRFRFALEELGWGVESVDLNIIGGAHTQIANVTIKISGPCPAQPYKAIAAALTQAFNQTFNTFTANQSTAIRFDRSTGCTLQASTGGTFSTPAVTMPDPDYVYAAGDLATVTVNAADEPAPAATPGGNALDAFWQKLKNGDLATVAMVALLAVVVLKK